MDWDRLRIFLTVADAHSFTHAGEVLDISQSAVSRQISSLEESLGVKLFHRHARGLLLTEQGETLLATVREMASKINKTESLLSDSMEYPKGGPAGLDDRILWRGVAGGADLASFSNSIPRSI